LAQGDWRYLVSSLVLGAIASSLGSMKLFPAAVLSLAGIAIAVHLIRARYISRLIKMIVVLVLVVIGFVYIFNSVADGVAAREIQEYLDPTLLNHYLGVYDSSVIGVYKTGRNSEAVYVWDKNLQDPLTFLFGKGIGARAESSTLGISGSYFESSFYPTGAGKSLPVLLQETGLIGMLTLAALCVAIIKALYKKARSNGDTDMAAIQYGLIAFTALWPLWLWYQPVWIQAIPMLLYWTSIGFALSPGNNHVVQEVYDVS
jgi:O-antigen ligase